MRLVAIGGGHGTAVVVKAGCQLQFHVTAVVSVEDDGGSSGKLREKFSIPAVGDIRRCIGASCSRDTERFLEERVGKDGHPIGNILLVAALEECHGDLTAAASLVAALVSAAAVVLPVSNTATDIVGDTPNGEVIGQTAIHARTDVDRLRVLPPTTTTTSSVIRAIGDADVIVVGPGSHFTSVLAALVVPGVTEAIEESSARLIWVANLPSGEAESRKLSVTKALQSLRDHGAFPEIALVDSDIEASDLVNMGLAVTYGSFGEMNRASHSVTEMARVLQGVMAD